MAMRFIDIMVGSTVPFLPFCSRLSTVSTFGAARCPPYGIFQESLVSLGILFLEFPVQFLHSPIGDADSINDGAAYDPGHEKSCMVNRSFPDDKIPGNNGTKKTGDHRPLYQGEFFFPFHFSTSPVMDGDMLTRQPQQAVYAGEAPVPAVSPWRYCFVHPPMSLNITSSVINPACGDT